MQRLGRFRVFAVVLALGLVSGACSGGAPKDEAPSATDQPASSSEKTEKRLVAAKPRTVATGGARITTSGGTTTLTAPSGVKVTKPKGGPPIANLFTRAEDKIGLHPEKIVLCFHGTTTLAAAFNVGDDDLTVYWDEVGKIHGRTIEVSVENDDDDPNTAVQAARACEQKDPFLLGAALGFETTPAVRKVAEDKHMFYMHLAAREDLTKRYSFGTLPTLERIGDLAAQWVGTRFKGKKVGIIYRQSENYDPGRVAFVKRLKAMRSNPVVAQAGVVKNQGTYFTELNELQGKGAQVVFVWDHPAATTGIVQQAKGQNWSPQFLLTVPASIQTDALGEQALHPPLHGIHFRPAYSPGDHSGPFASYAAEIKRFEAAYAKWRPGVKPSDVHWWGWLLFRDLHTYLVACGRDCTRNELLGLFLWRKYTADELAPSCPIDFTRNGHVGGFWTTMFTAYRRPNGTVGWRNIPGAVCRDSFLP